MNESHIAGCIASGMQFGVAFYALRLNRRFGTASVGWSLFGAFSLLALLHLIQSTAMFEAALDSGLKLNITYALASFLLLIGMLHLETLLKERQHQEVVERQLRADLELEVKSKTAHLTRAIEELMLEIEETKRVTAIIEAAEWPVTACVAAKENPVETSFFEPAEIIEPDFDPEQTLAGIMSDLQIARC